MSEVAPLRQRHVSRRSFHSSHHVDDTTRSIAGYNTFSAPLQSQKHSKIDIPDDAKGEKKKNLSKLFTTDVISILAVILSFCALINLYTIDDTRNKQRNHSIHYASVMFTLSFGLYTLYQRRRLKQLGKIHALHDDIEQMGKKIEAQNKLLQKKIMGMNHSVARLEAFERELQYFSESTGEYDINRLVSVASEIKRVSGKFERCIHAEIIYSLLRAVIDGDSNNEKLSIGPLDMEVLIVQLGIIGGVSFDDNKFRSYIAKNPNDPVKSIFHIIRTMKSRSETNDTIFKVIPEILS